MKNTIYNERPQGTGSCIGESYNDYMSPVKAKVGKTSSALHSPRNMNELTAGSNESKTKSKNFNINKALIDKAMKAAPMTAKPGDSRGKPKFNFNFGGIAEEAKQYEESHST